MSTLNAMLLVLCLAMSSSIGTWAQNKPSEEQIMGEWMNVLKGAEVALETDKFYAAMAMIEGVARRFDEDKTMSNDEKLAKFGDALKQIKMAVEVDNKIKAMALIKELATDFKGEVNKQQQPQPRKLDKSEVENFLKGAFEAIEEEQTEKAVEMINKAAEIIKKDKTLSQDQKAIQFLKFLEEADKFLEADAADKAEGAINAAALAIGLDHLEKKEKAKKEEAEKAKKEEATKEKELADVIKGALEAIKSEQKEKAEQMITAAVVLLKKDKTLSKEQKGIAFLKFLEEAEKFLEADSIEKAEGALNAAALAVGLDALARQAIKAGGRKAGNSGTEL